MIHSENDVIDISHYSHSTELLKDLRSSKFSIDQTAARVLVRDLHSDSKIEWFKEILDESKGSSLCDTLIEAAIFELPLLIHGKEGTVRLVLNAGPFELEIMEFKVIQHREGLLISDKNLLPAHYSESVQSLCYDAMVESLLGHPESIGTLEGNTIKVNESEISFLDGLTLDYKAPSFIRLILKRIDKVKLYINFVRADEGLLIKIELEFVRKQAKGFLSWDKVRSISKAGSLQAAVIGPGIHTSPAMEAATLPKPRSQKIFGLELQLQMELISLAQALEFARSVESQQIRTGHANVKLVNRFLSCIDKAKKIVLLCKNEEFGNFHELEIALEELLVLLPFQHVSSHPLVRSQINQIPLRHQKIVSAFEELRAEGAREEALT